MSTHVLLNLLNELRKSDKMQGFISQHCKPFQDYFWSQYFEADFL